MPSNCDVKMPAENGEVAGEGRGYFKVSSCCRYQ